MMDNTLEYLRPAMKRKQTAGSANTLRFSCYGVCIRIEFDSHIPLSEIRSILPPDSIDSGCVEGNIVSHCYGLKQAANPVPHM